MSTGLKLIDVEPSGTRTGLGCGPAGCSLPVEVKDYPDSPEGRNFRRARVEAGMSLRDCARRVGIDVVDLSAVERGSKRPENWSALWAAAGLMVLVLALVGCEEDNIRSCGSACFMTGQRMLSYSKTDGCHCEPASKDGGP